MTDEHIFELATISRYETLYNLFNNFIRISNDNVSLRSYTFKII